MKKIAIRKIAIPPIKPPKDSIFPCPYVCSASGGFIAILAAKSRITVTTLSNKAWILSVISPKLLETSPKISSTKNAENMAIKEI